MSDKFPLSVIELLNKYPELRAVGRLPDIKDGEKIQKIYCDITELVRQLDFKAYKNE